MGVAGDNHAIGKQLRGSGGIIVQVEDMQLHIDPGPGALVKARYYAINPRENTAILVSHAHLGHCNDVNALVSATTANGIDPKAILVGSKSLFEGLPDNEPFLTNYHKNCVERFVMLEKDKRVGINKVEIQALPAVHKDETAIGFKIFTPKFTLVYSGDTEYYKEMIEFYKGADIMVLNVQEPFGKKSEGHLSADDAVKILQKTKPRMAVITHYGTKMMAADPIYIAREIQKTSFVQTLAAKDGTAVNPVTCAIGMRQKTLNTYE